MSVLRLLHRWPAFFAAFIACVTHFASPARAAEEPPARITSVQFGFDGRMQPERWAPLRITIDQVNRPFSGTLVIAYPQDHVQRATLRVPAAGTPGVATPIEATICLRANADGITITLLDEDGRAVDRQRYGNTAQDPDAQPLLYDQREGLILCLGRVSPDRAVVPLELPPAPQDYTGVGQSANWSSQRLADNRASRLASLHTAVVDPLTLPSNWSAYDTVEALVIRTEELTDRISPSSREAIMRWVQGGGRLVLVVDQPGDLWRTWLPGNLASFITLADPQRVPVPDSWQGLLLAPDRAAERLVAEAKRAATQTPQMPGIPPMPAPPAAATGSDQNPPTELDSDGPTPDQPGGSPESVTGSTKGPVSETEKFKAFAATFPVAPSISARPVSIALPLQLSGWVADTHVSPPATSPSASRPAGSNPRHAHAIAAHGPVGLGFVTILTADPSMAAATPADEASRRLWLSSLEPVLQDWLAMPLPPAALRQQWWGGWSGGTSGSDDYQRQAVAIALNTLADRPGNTLDPIAVLIALLVCALLLAVLLGPVDGVMLHLKRKMHLSWATALIWITIISILAGFTPWLVRGNLPTMRLSTAVESAVIDHAGDATWRSTVHGLFAAQPGSRPLLISPHSLPSGSAFRGVAIGQYWDTAAPIFTPLSLVQSTTLSPRGSELSIWPTSIQQGQWSLRNLLSYGPTSAAEDPLPIRARAIRIDEHSLRIQIEGTPLPPPAVCTIRSGELRHSSLRSRGDITIPTQPGRLTFQETKPVTDSIPAYADAPVQTPFPFSPFDPRTSQAERRTYGNHLDLPGIQRQDLAIEARLATGRWALVTLECSIEVPAAEKGEPSIQSHQRTIRLLVPIEGSATPPLDPGATP